MLLMIFKNFVTCLPLKTKIALQVARKIAPCDSALTLFFYFYLD